MENKEYKNSETDEIIDVFSLLIEQRKSLQRKKCKGVIAPFSNVILDYINATKEHKDILEIFTNNIEPILQDCEIFYGMTETKAIDALVELSNYAAVFSGTKGYEYNRVCDLITKIRYSYPAQ